MCGEPVVVIATATHRDAICARLAATGFDVARVQTSGQVTFLDARETFAALMGDGMPEFKLFQRLVGEALEEIRARQRAPRVRAFAEMVDLLRRDGNSEGALRLEAMWKELGAAQPLSLLCAYGMATSVHCGATGHFEKSKKAPSGCARWPG